MRADGKCHNWGQLESTNLSISKGLPYYINIPLPFLTACMAGSAMIPQQLMKYLSIARERVLPAIQVFKTSAP